MNVLAYCDAAFLPATRRVLGEQGLILTCPPHTLETLPPATLEGRDFIYLDLHGAAGRATLYGGGGAVPALHVDTVRAADLTGTVVFATTCYLPETPFLDAFLQAGAVVVAGPARNYRYSPELGRLFRRAYAGDSGELFIPRRPGPARWPTLAQRATVALARAKQLLARQLWRWVASVPAMRDALAFQVYGG